MDSTDPDVLRTFLEERLPSGVVQDIMAQLATHSVGSKSDEMSRL